MLFCSAPLTPVYAFDDGPVKAIVDINTSSGHVLVENLITNNSNGWVTTTVYEWDNGDFLMKPSFKGEIGSTNQIGSSGRFAGRNWSYSGDTLIYYSTPAKGTQQFNRPSDDLSPDLLFFEVINGRGVKSSVFRNLIISGDSISGKYEEANTKTGIVSLGVSGVIKKLDDNNKYEWIYKVDGFHFQYVTEFNLGRLGASNWFPTYLRTRMVYPDGRQRVLNDYRVTDLSESRQYGSLSPEKIHSPVNIYSSSNGVLIPLTKKTIPFDPIPGWFNHKSKLILASFLVASAIFAYFLFSKASVQYEPQKRKVLNENKQKEDQ